MLTNTISQPRPLPSPPSPTLSWFTTYQERYKQGTLSEPVSWLNCWLDFFCAKTYPVLPSTFRALFSSYEFLSSFGKLYFRIFNPLLLHSSRCTPSSDPLPAMFLHTVCRRFCQPSEPCSDLILFNPLHCYKKSIHAAGNHHWSRQNIRLIRTLSISIIF